MTEAYPLQWPEGWPRTPPSERQSDMRFRGAGTSSLGTYKPRGDLPMGRARDWLLTELRKLGAEDVIISSNMRLRLDGLPYAAERRIDDPGVAVYFKLKKRSLVMARDAFVTVAGNLSSLRLAVEAMRQLARHGGDRMMERAFTGFTAITPPTWKKPWRQVFSLKPDWTGTVAEVTKIFREKAIERHPDQGGADTLMAELNVAYEEAKAELGG